MGPSISDAAGTQDSANFPKQLPKTRVIKVKKRTNKKRVIRNTSKQQSHTSSQQDYSSYQQPHDSLQFIPAAGADNSQK